MPTFTYTAGGRAGDSCLRDALDRFVELLLDQGGVALRALQREAETGSQRLRLLLEAGYLRQTAVGYVETTPTLVNACEERMLRELLRTAAGVGGRHAGGRQGRGAVVGDDTRPLLPGEEIVQVDHSASLGQALMRGLPVALREEDIVVRPGEDEGRCASVLLLDLSGSMARQGKFAAARRAALALRALVRRCDAGDELITAGFATRPVLLPGQALLEAMPRPVGLFDPHINGVRLPAAADVPEHFTNIQAGLRLARRHLRNRGRGGRQVLLITDGEPTAHLEEDHIVLSYPPTEATLWHTLAEARRCATVGITVSVFGLVEQGAAPALEAFVRRLAQAGGGQAVCCSARHLGRFLATRLIHNRSK